jgi:hypothetical protein
LLAPFIVKETIMSHSDQIHNHQKALYLEILRKAQKESDHRLVQIIVEKLGRTCRSFPRETNDGCKVFSFPEPHAPGAAVESDAPDWKSTRVWRILFLMFASFGFFTTWFLFFCEQFLPIKKW